MLNPRTINETIALPSQCSTLLSGCDNTASVWEETRIGVFQLLIGFEKGNVALWSLTGRDADRFTCDQALRAISWHWDGRQFVCALSDGSLCVWSTKKPSEPTQRWAPHSKDSGLSAQQRSPDEGRRGPREKCRSIGQVEWKHGQDGDELMIFSGGMPLDDSGVLPALTVLRGGKSATVLEMEHPIVAFTTLCASPFANALQEPYAVAVLLKNDFLIVDLTTPGLVVSSIISSLQSVVR